MLNRAACFLGKLDTQRSYSTEFCKVSARNAINDCTTALGRSWASSSLPQSICKKLRFRLDQATASYDSLNAGDFSVASVLFSASNDGSGHEFVNAIRQFAEDGAGTDQEESRWDTVTGTRGNTVSENSDADALIEYGETLYGNNLAKMPLLGVRSACVNSMANFSGLTALFYHVVNTLYVPAASAP